MIRTDTCAQGHRSVTMVTAMTQYETRLSYSAISAVVNDAVMIMPMIETIEGVQNVEQIAPVPGIDALFIGCADLCMEYVLPLLTCLRKYIVRSKLIISNRLGIPGQYDTELFQDTVARIAAAAEKASVDGRKVFVGLGGLEPRPDLLEKLAQKHACIRFAMAGRDIALLMGAMNKQVAAMEAISQSLQK